VLRAATPERLSAFSDAVFAVLITVYPPSRRSCGSGLHGRATQSATFSSQLSGLITITPALRDNGDAPPDVV
jgi:hypothetical protein